MQNLSAMDTTLAQHFRQYALEVGEQVEIQLKYARYLEKEQEWAEKSKRLETYLFPTNFDYDRIRALSSEAVEKLKKVRPATLGQATKISGVSPADISILMVYLGR